MRASRSFDSCTTLPRTTRVESRKLGGEISAEDIGYALPGGEAARKARAAAGECKVQEELASWRGRCKIDFRQPTTYNQKQWKSSCGNRNNPNVCQGRPAHMVGRGCRSAGAMREKQQRNCVGLGRRRACGCCGPCRAAPARKKKAGERSGSAPRRTAKHARYHPSTKRTTTIILPTSISSLCTRPTKTRAPHEAACARRICSRGAGSRDRVGSSSGQSA